MTKLPPDHPLNDPVSGERLRNLMDGQWKNDGRRDRLRPPSTGALYVKTDDVIAFFKMLHRERPDESYVLLTHNSDLCVSVDAKTGMARVYHYRHPHKGEMCEVPPQIKKWFAINVQKTASDLVVEVPIGLVNSEWPAGNLADWRRAALEPRTIRNWAYCCFSVPTNPEARKFLWEWCQNRDGVTVKGGVDHMDVDALEYMMDLRAHPLILCPVGAGPQTHRYWEALYMGAVPVTDPTPEKVQMFMEMAGSPVFRDWRPELRLSYWRDLIRKEADAL